MTSIFDERNYKIRKRFVLFSLRPIRSQLFLLTNQVQRPMTAWPNSTPIVTIILFGIFTEFLLAILIVGIPNEAFSFWYDIIQSFVLTVWAKISRRPNKKNKALNTFQISNICTWSWKYIGDSTAILYSCWNVFDRFQSDQWKPSLGCGTLVFCGSQLEESIWSGLLIFCQHQMGWRDILLAYVSIYLKEVMLNPTCLYHPYCCLPFFFF